ncbi:MAG: DinB family protein [bacterium]
MKSSPDNDPSGAPFLSEKELSVLEEKVKLWSVSQKMAAFSRGPKRLKESFKKFPKSMWQYTSEKGNWTVGQVLWHLADQEANLYVRLRRGVAETGQTIVSFDQEKWDQNLLYKKADPIQARELTILLRQANADLLKRVGNRAWNAVVKHPEWGTLTLENLVGRNIWHLEHHLAQMGRRLAEWKNH